MLPEVAEPAGWSLERVSGAAAAVNRAARLAGAPLAGLLIVFVGPTNVLWIDAATFVFSAAAIAFGVPPRATARHGPEEGSRHQLRHRDQGGASRSSTSGGHCSC